MRLLITGAGGQVGRELARQAPLAGFETLALDSRELDITDAAAVRRTIDGAAVDAVINAAAYTAVDRAEQEPDRAYAVNRDGPAHLAEACVARGIPLLHISTDYVFDGRKTEPYREDDPVDPPGVYGASKWAGEQAVRERLDRHLILRTSWVFGMHGHNFVRTMLRLAAEREVLRVVADQHGCPTFAGDIARALLTVAARLPFSDDSAWGTYHFAGAPATNWYDFARTIIDRARPLLSLTVQDVQAITTAEYPTPATRPAYSVLDGRRFRNTFGIAAPDWHAGLMQVIQHEVES
jgi:dTDP-4-dehydrorhamnose reductase